MIRSYRSTNEISVGYYNSHRRWPKFLVFATVAAGGVMLSCRVIAHVIVSPRLSNVVPDLYTRMDERN